MVWLQPLLLLVFSLLLLPVLLIVAKPPLRVVVLLLLTGPLIQETALAVSALALHSGDWPFLPITILQLYPFYLFPWGLWSVILALALGMLAIRLGWPFGLSVRRRFLTAVIVGGVTGIAFVSACISLLPVDEQISLLGSATAWICWEVGGFCAGAANAAIIAFLLEPKSFEPPPLRD